MDSWPNLPVKAVEILDEKLKAVEPAPGVSAAPAEPVEKKK